MQDKIIILGAGISGLSTAYHLRKQGIPSVIYEQEKTSGGLCSNFIIDGFRFDRFIHLSFTTSEYVKNLFSKSSSFYTHEPNPFSYYKGIWLKHPAQNNLFPLPCSEKKEIIKGFKNRPKDSPKEICNYEQWLRAQYGDCFAEKFPLNYTEKYWTVPASQLGIKWVGNRMYQPSLEEVCHGAQSPNTPNTYYAKEMRYPKKGGYKSFLKELEKGSDVQLEQKVIRIDCKEKTVHFSNGNRASYDVLISSLPLPELCKIITDIPFNIRNAGQKLKWTSAYLVSIGLLREIPLNLWFYIYGKENLPARVYSPSCKSSDNTPKGCSSLQAEVYFSSERLINQTPEQILNSTISSLINMGVISEKDICVQDIRIEKYANVIFTHDIYKNRDIVHNYLDTMNIKYIGRFGRWEYLWSDQSLLSGKKMAENLTKNTL